MPSIYSLQPTAYSRHVVAGALFNANGLVLIAQRPHGKHMEGGWEFPGGKVDAGEEPFAGLVRELKEELGILVHSAERVIAYTHQYADRAIYLDLWIITRYEGVPASMEGQPLKWVKVDDLEAEGLLPADKPMIEPLRRAVRCR